MKGRKNKINKSVIAIVNFNCENIEEIITSSQDAAPFFFQNKLSHKQFVFSLLHHLVVYFSTWLYYVLESFNFE